MLVTRGATSLSCIMNLTVYRSTVFSIMITNDQGIKRYSIQPTDLGTIAFVSTPEQVYYTRAIVLLRGCVFWVKDYSVSKGYCLINYGSEDLEAEAKYHLGTDIVLEKGNHFIQKDGEEYCVALCKDYLKMATQDQVDTMLYNYDLFRIRRRVQRYTHANCIVLWKGDFIRIGDKRDIDKRRMLCLYLGIYTEDNLGDGIGMIDGFAIADFNTFSQVASQEQIAAVKGEFARRNGTPTISQMWRDKQKPCTKNQ